MLKFNLKSFFYIDKKERMIYFLSFLLPLVLLIAILISKQVYPFGEKCILRTDFYHQYLPFHSELAYKLKNFKSLFYTYDVGLGTNFITLMAYYLVCPFNLLLMFIGENIILEYLTLVLVIKISLSGLSFSYYLIKKYKTDNMSFILFSLLYAMSGYIAAYYWNIMWIDNIILFPLVILGFEKMLNGGKPYLYIISLAASILCNYYIGAIVCLFLIFYFVLYSFLINVKIKRAIKNLLFTGIYSLCAVLISSILLIPVIYAFKTTASSDTSFPKSISEYFTIPEILGRHLPFVKVENGIEYWPNIYVGMVVIGLIFIYFLNKKFKIREKICYALLILFFFASFSINIFDYVSHVFKFPNSLPCRQSFIYTFFLITIAVKPILKINSIKIKDIVIAFSIPIVLFMLIEKNIINEKVKFTSVYLGIIILFIYMIIFLMYKTKRYDKTIIFYVAIIVVSLEAFLNMYFTSFSTITRKDYMKDTNVIRNMTSDIKNLTDEFYRVERVDYKTKNDGAFLNFPSASIFSSAAYLSGSDFYKQFGMEASTNAYSLNGSTPLMDALLSIKYKVEESEDLYYKKRNKRLISNVDNLYLYQNLFTLPISFVLINKFLNKFEYTSSNPATVQNNFSRSMDTGAILEKQQVKIDGTNAKLYIEKDGEYYAFVRDKSIKDLTVIFQNTTKEYKYVNRGYFVELGYQDRGTEVEFRNDVNDKELLIEVFRFDFDVFKNIIDKINSSYVFDMEKFNETNLRYNIDAKVDGMCVITLPNDKGFKLLVDGEEVSKHSLWDFFIAFNIKKGQHKVELIYTPLGFKEGALLSLLGVIMFIIIYIIKKEPRYKVPSSDDKLNIN